MADHFYFIYFGKQFTTFAIIIIIIKVRDFAQICKGQVNYLWKKFLKKVFDR